MSALTKIEQYLPPMKIFLIAICDAGFVSSRGTARFGCTWSEHKLSKITLTDELLSNCCIIFFLIRYFRRNCFSLNLIPSINIVAFLPLSFSFSFTHTAHKRWKLVVGIMLTCLPSILWGLLFMASSNISEVWLESIETKNIKPPVKEWKCAAQI